MKPRSYEFYEEVPAGVQEPTPPAAPAAPASDPQPASEGVTTPGGKEQYVPYERFSEVNNGLKAEREARQKLEADLEAIRSNPGSLFATKEPEPSLDPDVDATLERWAKAKGLVTKQELEGERARAQAETDLAALKSEHNLTDEQITQVRQAAADAGATNKRGLDNAYKALFLDKIVEDKVKEALAKAGNPAVAERPGPGGAKAPESGTKGQKLSMADRIKAAAARQTQS